MTISLAEIERQNGVGCGHNPEFRFGCAGTMAELGGSQEGSLQTLCTQKAAKARRGRVAHLGSPSAAQSSYD